jgi:hypothetical protein
MIHSRATAESVAERILKAVERKQLYVFAPAIAGLFWRLKRMMPRLLLRFVASNYRSRLAAANRDAENAPPPTHHKATNAHSESRH